MGRADAADRSFARSEEKLRFNEQRAVSSIQETHVTAAIAAFFKLKNSKELRAVDIVRFVEQVCIKHNLDPAISVELKQALFLFARGIELRFEERR